MTEETIKALVVDYKAGMKNKALAAKYSLKEYVISSILGRLRKAGANIPKHTAISPRFDYTKLASEINAQG